MKVTEGNLIPAWLVTVAPEANPLPWIVAGELWLPGANELGLIDVGAGGGGGGPIVRKPGHESATGPGSITVTSRGPRLALVPTKMLATIVVGEVTVTDRTLIPELLLISMDGLPEKPLPVSLTAVVVPGPMIDGLTLLIGGPGVAAANACRPNFPPAATSRLLPTNTGCPNS